MLKATVPRYPVATLPNASCAVTPKGLVASAEIGEVNPATTNDAAAAGETTIPEAEATRSASVAVTDRVPAVFSVAEKTRTPASAAVKVCAAGSAALVSFELKVAVPR